MTKKITDEELKRHDPMCSLQRGGMYCDALCPDDDEVEFTAEDMEMVYEAGDLDRSTLYERYMEPQDPPDYETHYNLGVAYEEIGQNDEALQEFLRVSQSPDPILVKLCEEAIRKLDEKMEKCLLRRESQSYVTPRCTNCMDRGCVDCAPLRM
ncbi:MAG: hypothetical protein M3M85_03190 [bacterium]|nr:hypothetical protein [bacterium]